ncbi:DUF2267 domain-containing protein [Streptomyces oceani]|uniref:DUF2267 domain-containing protein n=1 Tax=Streptomyces oceani TaxID=1075402 RepID=A0A1E7KGX8_9ACTN|nr:DUF2267 domain-containing protein [Streptomyces oceani]OEV03212.1 hypothetical protein AN216_12795 [Streptomyces oceani]
MEHDAFLAAVRERGAYDQDEARSATVGVLAMLGRRLPPESAEHLADQLPGSLGEILGDAQARSETWGVQEFLARIAQATGVDETSAEEEARAVLSTVGETVSGGELNKVLGRLPAGYAALFGHPELAG